MIHVFFRSKALLAFVLAISIALPSTSHALLEQGPKISTIEIWSIDNYADIVKSKNNRTVVKIVHAISTIFAATPGSNALVLAYFKAAGRDRDRVVANLIKICGSKKSFPKVEQRLVCLTHKIHDYVDALPMLEGTHGFTKDARTACTIAANLFEMAFNGLRIPRARASYMTASAKLPSLHVVNTVTMTAKDGRTFGYVVDVGILPQYFFPSSMHSIAFHDPNEDGEVDVFNFPDLDFEHPPDHMTFMPAKK